MTGPLRGSILARGGDDNPRLVFSRLEVADSFQKRLIGLLRTPNLSLEEGLLLPGTRQVHTFGMRYGIDLIFLAATGEITYIQEQLRPWRFSKFVQAATMVLEVAGGAANHHGISVGDMIVVQSA